MEDPQMLVVGRDHNGSFPQGRDIIYDIMKKMKQQ
jgi:hypothetical protein